MMTKATMMLMMSMMQEILHMLFSDVFVPNQIWNEMRVNVKSSLISRTHIIALPELWKLHLNIYTHVAKMGTYIQMYTTITTNSQLI